MDGHEINKRIKRAEELLRKFLDALPHYIDGKNDRLAKSIENFLNIND